MAILDSVWIGCCVPLRLTITKGLCHQTIYYFFLLIFGLNCLVFSLLEKRKTVRDFESIPRRFSEMSHKRELCFMVITLQCWAFVESVLHFRF